MEKYVNTQMTTGSTPGIGSWEGRLANDGWCLFLQFETSRKEFYKLTWLELRNKLKENKLTLD